VFGLIFFNAPLLPSVLTYSVVFWFCYRRVVLPGDTPISHVIIALRGRATRNSRLGHYATKFADARLKFLSADEC
jgi:hypothetical protein